MAHGINTMFQGYSEQPEQLFDDLLASTVGVMRKGATVRDAGSFVSGQLMAVDSQGYAIKRCYGKVSAVVAAGASVINITNGAYKGFKAGITVKIFAAADGTTLKHTSVVTAYDAATGNLTLTTVLPAGGVAIGDIVRTDDGTQTTVYILDTSTTVLGGTTQVVNVLAAGTVKAAAVKDWDAQAKADLGARALNYGGGDAIKF